MASKILKCLKQWHPRSHLHVLSENNLGVDGGRGDGEVNCLCCGGRCLVPTSIVTKLNKLSSRGGLYKFFGDFGLRVSIL
jgi:hypothetical protein